MSHFLQSIIIIPVVSIAHNIRAGPHTTVWLEHTYYSLITLHFLLDTPIIYIVSVDSTEEEEEETGNSFVFLLDFVSHHSIDRSPNVVTYSHILFVEYI